MTYNVVSGTLNLLDQSIILACWCYWLLLDRLWSNSWTDV